MDKLESVRPVDVILVDEGWRGIHTNFSLFIDNIDKQIY